MLSRDVLTPLRLAERWGESSADEQGWSHMGATSARPGPRDERTGTTVLEGVFVDTSVD